MPKYFRRVVPAIAVTVTASVTVALSVAGCSFGGTTASAGPGVEKPNLTVAVVPAVDSAGFFIALYDGLFKAQGLNVTFVPAVSSETAIGDQIKGTFDITGGNYVSYIQAQHNGQANLDIFAEGSVMQPGAQALYTMPASKIKTLADLKGKTIGINAPNNILYLLVASVLTENGIPVSDVHFKTNIPLPAMATALKAGQIDAAVLPEPFASTAQQMYGAVTLADLNQGATSAFPIQGYVVTKQWAAAYPRTLAAFERALEEGQSLADTNRADLEHAMESVQPPQLAVSAITAAVMAVPDFPVGPVDPVRIQRVADVMSQFIQFPSFNVTSMIGN